MYQFFPTEFFNFEYLRILATAPFHGSEIGECLSARSQLPSTCDPESWYRVWTAQAEQAVANGEEALAAGDKPGAAWAFLRASNYFRTSEFFLHCDVTDGRMLGAMERSVGVFERGAELLQGTRVVGVEVPYEEGVGGKVGGRLPGRLFLPTVGRQGKIPLVVQMGGFDSTQEELYFVGPAGAVGRGYAVLTFEGPGQGIVLRRDGLKLRPDWEAVTSRVLDVVESQLASEYALDMDRIAVVGSSLGGYLSLRAAADPRVAACISFDGCYDLFDVTRSRMPGWFINGWLNGTLSDGFFNFVVNRLAAWNFQLRWEFGHSMWVYGVDTPAEVMRMMRRFHLRGYLEKIKCSVLVTGAADTFYFTPELNAERIFEGLGHLPEEKKRLWIGRGVEGGGLQAKVAAFGIMHIQAAATLNNLTLTIPPFPFGTENKTPAFLAKFPTGKVPAFEGVEGTTLVESDAIAWYIAGSGPCGPALQGRNVADQARIRQWISFSENEVYGAMLSVVLWRAGFRRYDDSVEAGAVAAMEYALGVVERHLQQKQEQGGFLVGGELTLADLTLASALYWAFMHYLDRGERERFPGVVAWYLRVIGGDKVREVFGEAVLVEKKMVAPV
ncbi:hypothetical protein BO70DRAFT_293213 [Aspergillus heteromorphus CBS 117.55]|uniref:GST C-terminal domain-containing protein n=1 Tax=Aspergillus heteromorphus CBS 117.55 TaxID=1448321 RepID=A0A317VZB5_9EURO|nr:uncharacterized protein BO70DRAFT_293213 [Aspergillus heteromorphus CBS 117.55]PWY79696.1 hypothetical protein BO70DRAFT_293213 [Aspergillus heteromorphus CBS 117.55]